MNNSQLISLSKENYSAHIPERLPGTRVLVEAALEHADAVYLYPETSIFRIESGDKSWVIPNIYLPLCPYSAAELCDRKNYTKTVLDHHGIPTPQGIEVHKKDFEESAIDFSAVQFPVVIKPMEQSLKGDGIVTDIQNEEDLSQYLENAFRTYSKMLVEEYYGGLLDYRVLVLDGKVIDVLWRVRPYVIGDGEKTIRTLIEIKNAERKAETRLKLGPILIDEELKNKLNQAAIDIDSIPKKDERVQLKNVCNFGAGGEVVEVTNDICTENIELMAQVTKTLGMRFAGIDVLAEDISKPVSSTRGVILEVNERPDIPMHYFAERQNECTIADQVIKAIISK